MSYQVIISSGQENRLLAAYFLAAAVNVALNMVLIPRFAQNGAALASVVTELLVNAILLHYSRRILKVSLDWPFMIGTFLACVAMAVPMLVTNFLVHNVFVGLFVDVVLAVITYFAFCLVTKNEVLLMIMDLVRKKKRPA